MFYTLKCPYCCQY